MAQFGPEMQKVIDSFEIDGETKKTIDGFFEIAENLRRLVMEDPSAPIIRADVFDHLADTYQALAETLISASGIVMTATLEEAFARVLARAESLLGERAS